MSVLQSCMCESECVLYVCVIYMCVCKGVDRLYACKCGGCECVYGAGMGLYVYMWV